MEQIRHGESAMGNGENTIQGLKEERKISPLKTILFFKKISLSKLFSEKNLQFARGFSV